MKTLVALLGYKGSGKTLAAEYLMTQGYTKMSFAEPLKQMLLAMGLTQDQIYGDKKEVQCHMLGGKTPRYAMQTLGTEWGRRLISDDLWIRVMETNIRKHSGKVVIDDCRFINEATMVKSSGGVLLRISRPGTKATLHESEQQCDLIIPDKVIYNDSDKPALFEKLYEAVQ